MSDAGSGACGARIARVRAHLSEAGLDALLVTHLPNLAYLTGLRASAGCALLTRRGLTLVVDFRYAESGRAAVARIGEAGGAALEVAARSLDEAVAARLLQEGVRRLGIEAAYLPVKRLSWLEGTLGGQGVEIAPTERLVERERLVKGPEEVATLREAGRRLSAVARGLADLVRAGRTEQEVAAELDHAVRLAGFERPAFETIVASGPRSAMPHARPEGRVLALGDPVVLDFGGVYDGYCVDLTRTVSVGAPEDGVRRLYEAVLDAHTAALAAIHPGVVATAVDRAAREALGRRGLAEAFGHGTGHGLGLEVHEEPRVGRPVSGQTAETLAPGMVFTVEPGVYVPGAGGVRIEDDVLVTAQGYELLTDAPRSLLAV